MEAGQGGGGYGTWTESCRESDQGVRDRCTMAWQWLRVENYEMNRAAPTTGLREGSTKPYRWIGARAGEGGRLGVREVPPGVTPLPLAEPGFSVVTPARTFD